MLSIYYRKIHFIYSAAHVKGVDNVLADALSRNNVDLAGHHTPSIGGSTSSLQTGLVISQLDQAVDFYFLSVLAPSTQHTYTSARGHYCKKFGLTLLPVVEHQLSQFVSFLSEDGVLHTSIKCYLSAVRHLQIS